MIRITDQDVTRAFRHERPVDAAPALQRAFQCTQTHAITNVEEQKRIVRMALPAYLQKQHPDEWKAGGDIAWGISPISCISRTSKI